MNVTCTYFSLKTDGIIAASAHQVRGAIAGRARENLLFHHHEGDHLVYECPLIQYKILDGFAIILAMGKGIEPLRNVLKDIAKIRFGTNVYAIKAIEESTDNIEFGLAPVENIYEFVTPWLALNEENYERYKAVGPNGQNDLLRRTLIGNILSMSKGLGYVVTEEIKVSKLDVYPVRKPVFLKGVPMVGFKGRFAVNFELPDYIGLGKSVSRGFGTIKTVGE
jgi:hypothetical protein